MPKTTISQIIHDASVQLTCARVEDPLLNLRVLLSYATGIPSKEVLDNLEHELTDEEVDNIISLVDRRARRETLNRILGESEFCGLWFETNEATLEPRPESEIIVRAIVKKIKTIPWFLGMRKPLRVLDLGTGSGCILLSFLHALPNATGIAVDLAPRALEQARANARRLGLEGRCEFRLNDWATGIMEQFDIVSFNPPYINRADMAMLMPAVRDFDPVLALYGGEDGMDPYRLVVPQLPRLLKKGGYAGIELGDYQTKEIGAMVRNAGFQNVSLCIDYRGFDRVFIIHNK